MRIAMLTPYFYPVIGGTEKLIENISVKLNEKGVSTDVITFKRASANQEVKPLRKASTERITRIKITKIPVLANILGERLFQVKYIPCKFLNFLENYDLLHFHNDFDLTFPVFSYLVNKPKIFHFHCLDMTYNSFKRNLMKKLLLKNIADLYIALSTYILELLLDLGISEETIRVVPNGVNIERLRPSKAKKKENLLLFAGRLIPKKGLHVLLKSLSYLTTPVRLVIVGPTSSYFPEYFTKISDLIESTNSRTVHEITYAGIQKRGDLIEWYQKASVFVCPSLSDPFPLVNLEALSCETPVIASNVGGIPDVVKGHINGILVPPNDAIHLADSIQYLLDNVDIRRKFGKNGRMWIKEHFSTDVVAKRLCQIYKEQIS